MRLMGDKITARKAAEEAGLPITPGSPALESVEHAIEWANKIGYPVIVKATAGGGGKGMKIAFNDEEMKEAFTMAKAEAKAAFTSDVVYMEKYLQKPRHIEMQVLADKYGNVVHLGERDCSIPVSYTHLARVLLQSMDKAPPVRDWTIWMLLPLAVKRLAPGITSWICSANF